MPAILQRSKPIERGDCVPCEERAGARSPLVQDVRLSIAHTDSIHPQILRSWPQASLAIIPAGEDRNPNSKPKALARGVRGKITTLSDGSRRRILHFLSTLESKVRGYTFSLTLPEDGELMPPELVHAMFMRLARNFTASSRWSHVGAVYKREFQKRGALHYHFAFYGVKNDSESRNLQWWLTQRWVRYYWETMKELEKLDCRDQTFDFNPKEKTQLKPCKMIEVHMHPTNMERIRSTVSSYFAKYLGKAEGATGKEVPGKWWGKLNEPSLPVVPERQEFIAKPIIKRVRRWASTLQKKRTQYGVFRSYCIKAGFTDPKGQPLFTLQQFHQARNPLPVHLTETSLQLNKLWTFQEMRKKLISLGYRSGLHNRPRFNQFAKISLVGSAMPETAQKMIDHALQLWIDEPLPF